MPAQRTGSARTLCGRWDCRLSAVGTTGRRRWMHRPDRRSRQSSRNPDPTRCEHWPAGAALVPCSPAAIVIGPIAEWSHPLILVEPLSDRLEPDAGGIRRMPAVRRPDPPALSSSHRQTRESPLRLLSARRAPSPGRDTPSGAGAVVRDCRSTVAERQTASPRGNRRQYVAMPAGPVSLEHSLERLLDVAP